MFIFHWVYDLLTKMFVDHPLTHRDISFILEAKSDLEFIAGEAQLGAEVAVSLKYDISSCLALYCIYFFC